MTIFKASDKHMDRLGLAEYQQDLAWCCGLSLPWDKLSGKTVAISGATGMIGSTFIDVLMAQNLKHGLGCQVVALGRSENKAHKRLPYFGNAFFSFEQMDVGAFGAKPSAKADYIVHLASTTHPKAYSTNPIGTVSSNVVGLFNLLEYACECDVQRFEFASSVEVYGENRGDVERFDEGYLGIINCNTLRAGYPESKRLGESLCQAYRAQKGIDVVIPRLPRTYGVTLLPNDTKALTQFIHKGVRGEDVILKSEGMQRYSYLNVIDSVSGLLWVLLVGSDGEAYNISDEGSDAELRQLAQAIASEVGTQVIFDLPDAAERAGYSTATKALMDASKLKATGWTPRYLSISDGLRSTIRMMRQLA